MVPTEKWDFDTRPEREFDVIGEYVMAIQVLSTKEVEAVAGGVFVLGLDVNAVVAALAVPTLGIVVSALAIVDSSVAASGVIVGNVLAGVNNQIVGLGL